MSNKKVAIITGANSGVGLSTADRLLTIHQSSLRVCLACRNQLRAEAARQQLKRDHPDADIDIVKVDTSSVKSVLSSVEEIRRRYSRLDYLYLNAGVMKIEGVNWDRVMLIFTGPSKAKYILSTGHGALRHRDGVTDDGLQEVFATNVFGHFVLVRELEELLEASSPAQVIWTGSQNGDLSVLDLNNIQHKDGFEPYASSKYVTDIVSVSLNEKLNKKGIFSHTTCPGLTLTGMTYGIIPQWFWYLVLPILYIMRLFVKSICRTPYNASEALVWLSQQQPETLDPRLKYCSYCTFWGTPYSGGEKLQVKDEDAKNVYDQLEVLYQGFKTKYSANETCSK